VRKTGHCLAPSGDEKCEGSFSHFYGAFLLGLSLDQQGLAIALSPMTDRSHNIGDPTPNSDIIQSIMDEAAGGADILTASTVPSASDIWLNNWSNIHGGQGGPAGSGDSFCVADSGSNQAMGPDFDTSFLDSLSLPLDLPIWDPPRGTGADTTAEANDPLEWLLSDPVGPPISDFTTSDPARAWLGNAAWLWNQ
jgi:hypothetical protein